MEKSIRYYLLRTLSRLPLALMMFVIDSLVFNSLLQPLAESTGYLAAASSSYWLIHSFVYIIFVGLPPASLFARDEPFVRDFRAILIGLYGSKFFGLLLFAIGALVLGGISGLSLLLDGALPAGSWQILQAASLFGAAALFLALFYGMLRNRYRFQLRTVQVPIANLPKELEGFTIVQFSDAHLGSIAKPEAIRPGIALINEQKADLVCFTGDLVNSVAEEARPFLSELSKIAAKHGVVAILGNHDYGDYVRWPSAAEKEKNMSDLLDIHKQMNWRLLRDESLQLTIDGQALSIIGVENISGKGQFKNYGNLEKAYPETTGSTKILLTHDPSHWRSEVLHYKDITLSLSGHTHGMQFGFEFGKYLRWSPVKWVYKEWAGLYQEGEQYLYVNRGFGFLGYPGRVGILPEITRIELICKTET